MQTVPTKTPTTETPTSESLIKERDRAHVRNDVRSIPLPLRSPSGGRHIDCGEHCAREFEHVLLLNGPNRVAALILEPIVGANGVIVPAEGYLQEVRRICDKYGVLLIADEVMTGFGRTGRWFACEHWGVVPDILTVAKGMTGGYVPMGATIVRDSLARHWDEHRFVHGHTYSGHALGCAAAAASIQAYQEDDLINRSAEQGEYLLAGARELMERHPSVGDVRGKGLFVGMELVRNRETLDRCRERVVYGPQPGAT